MSLLIDIREPGWLREHDLRETLSPLLPGVSIYCENAEGHEAEITMLATVKLYPGVVGGLPNLKLVQKLGAGVDGILKDSTLPENVRVCRLKPDAPAEEIAEYCLAYVLQTQRNIRFHADNASQGIWHQVPPKKRAHTTIGILGLGHIGGRTARTFTSLGFPVMGWSRTQKQIDGITCLAGIELLPTLLKKSDYVISILPSTPETRHLFDIGMFEHMRSGAVLVNAGRGDLIDEQALLLALDRGNLAGAVLDVFVSEPLPGEHPFWTHPKITVTPHVSGWHLDGAFEDIAENYRRLHSGAPLLHQVDRQAGY